MSVLEMVLLLGFGVPIVLGSCAFVLCASFMQMKEEQSARKQE